LLGYGADSQVTQTSLSCLSNGIFRFSPNTITSLYSGPTSQYTAGWDYYASYIGNASWDNSGVAWNLPTDGINYGSTSIVFGWRNIYFCANAGISTSTITDTQMLASTRMTIMSNGYVGIGTTTPSNALSVYTTALNVGLVFQNAYNNSTGSIGLYTTNAAGNYIVNGTANAGVIIPVDGNDLFLSRNASFNTSLMVQGGTGNVGIGFANPHDYLHIMGTTSSAIRIGASTALTSVSQLIFDEAISGFWHINGYGNAPTTSARGQALGAAMIQSGNESTNNYEDSYMSFHTCRDAHSDGMGGLGVLYERMRINSLGYVGIGTANPSYPLHLAISAAPNITLASWLGSAGVTVQNNPQTGLVTSLYSLGWGITPAAWGVTSDRRIKTNIEPVSNMLSIIDQVNVVQYDYIDPRLGTEKCSVIAQELNAIFPNAINVTTDYVPNIFKSCTHVLEDGIVTITVPLQSTADTINDIKVDARLKLVLSDDTITEREITIPILAVNFSDNTIQVAAWDNYLDSTHIIVYGTEVKDFLSNDKPQLGVMALQGVKELHQIIATQQATIDRLSADYTKLLAWASTQGFTA